jgi:hypothetical protein
MGARSHKKILIFLYIIIIISIIYLYFSYRHYNHIEGFDDIYELPKTIWTFWDTDEQPQLIKDIQKHNRKILKEGKKNREKAWMLTTVIGAL